MNKNEMPKIEDSQEESEREDTVSPMRRASGVEAYLARTEGNNEEAEEEIIDSGKKKYKPKKVEREEVKFERIKPKRKESPLEEVSTSKKEGSKKLSPREERYKKIDDLNQKIGPMELEASEKPEEQRKLADLKRELLTLLSEESDDLWEEGRQSETRELVKEIDRLRNSFNSDPAKVIEQGQKHFINKKEILKKFPDAFNFDSESKRKTSKNESRNTPKKDNDLDWILDKVRIPQFLKKLEEENIKLSEKNDPESIKNVQKNLERMDKLKRVLELAQNRKLSDDKEQSQEKAA